jgi:hypothetical protein
MDPLSLSSIVVDLGAKFLSTAHRCHTLYDKDKTAFATVQVLNHKSRSIITLLDGINVILLDRRNAPVTQSLDIPHWHESLMIVLDACSLTCECLDNELTKLGDWTTQGNNKVPWWRRVRLHWNEESLKSTSTLLDTTVGSLRCLLDVLKTAMLGPVVERASGSRLKMQVTVLQQTLIETDDKIGAHFSRPCEYTDEIGNIVYPRYRDNINCIRSICSPDTEKCDDFGVVALSSTSNLADSEQGNDDAWSFTSMTPLIAPEMNEKAVGWQSDALTGVVASDLGPEIRTAEETTAKTGSYAMEKTPMASTSSIDGGKNDDDADDGRVPRPLLMADLFQELGISKRAIDNCPNALEKPNGLFMRSEGDQNHIRRLWSELTSSVSAHEGDLSTLEMSSTVSDDDLGSRRIGFTGLKITVLGHSG